MIVEAAELQKFKLLVMPFYWMWMDSSLPYDPQFLSILYRVDS